MGDIFLLCTPGLKTTTELARVYVQPQRRTQDPKNVPSWTIRGDTWKLTFEHTFSVLKESCIMESLFALKDTQDQ